MEDNCFRKLNVPLDETVLKCKENYYQKLIEYDEKQGGIKKPWTEAKLQEVISQIKSFREATISGKQRTSNEYYWTNKYDIITTVNGEYLTFKKKNDKDQAVLILPREQYFDILYEVHESCGHGGRDKMAFTLKPKVYIPVKAIEIFLTVCPKCSTKNKKGVILVRPNLRGLFKLIDFQSYPDEDFKWLLHYQDDATRYTCLRPLKTNRIKEVSLELLKLFLTFGAPDCLHSSIGEEYTLNVINQINALWPSCKIQPTQANKLAFDQDADIENMLHTWMSDSNSLNWSLGCYFVQNIKNVSAIEIIGKTPYKAFFGRDPKNFPHSTSSTENMTKPIEEVQCKKTDTIESDIEEQKSSDDEPSLNDNENTNYIVNKQKFQSLQNLTCIVCQTEATAKTGAHKCMSCKSVHIICGLSDGSEISDSKIVCFICNRAIEGNEGHKGVKRGAENFVERPEKIAATSLQTVMNRDPLTIPVSFDVSPCRPCTCKPGHQQCRNQKCACFKKNITCKPTCHNSASCSNRP